MKHNRLLAGAALALFNGLVQSRIFVDDSCKDIRSEVVTAVGAAIEWADIAKRKLEQRDRATTEAAALVLGLFVAEGAERLGKVVNYVERGENGRRIYVSDGNAPADIAYGDMVIYCDTSKWVINDSKTTGKGFKWNEQLGFETAISILDEFERSSNTLAQTITSEKTSEQGQYARADSVILHRNYLAMLPKKGYEITEEMFVRASDGKRAKSFAENAILTTVNRKFTPIDYLADALPHTILHELTHGHFGGDSIDLEGAKSYGWKKSVDLKTDLNADNLAFMGLVAWLIDAKRATVDRNGKLVPSG